MSDDPRNGPTGDTAATEPFPTFDKPADDNGPPLHHTITDLPQRGVRRRSRAVTEADVYTVQNLLKSESFPLPANVTETRVPPINMSTKPKVPQPGPARLKRNAGPDQWLEAAKNCKYLSEPHMKQLCEIVKEYMMEGKPKPRGSVMTRPLTHFGRVEHTTRLNTSHNMW